MPRPVPFRVSHVVGAALMAAVVSKSHAAILYVNAAQALPLAQQNGSSWALAYQQLPDAILVATSGDQIWVAEGTYRPTTGTNRGSSIVAKSGVTLLGGFAVGAASLAERDPATFVSILSGDIGVPGDPSDNSFHVLRSALSNGAVVDGFTIRDGNADGPIATDRTGGNIDATACNLLVRGCRIEDGRAFLAGGGLAVLNNHANGTSVRVVDCVFLGNQSNSGGAADVQNGGASFVNCRFLGNSTTSNVGAVRLLNATNAKIANCVFSGNSAPLDVGAILVHHSSAEVQFSSFSGNSGGTADAIQAQVGSTLLVSNCLFHGNTSPSVPDVLDTSSSTIQHCGFESSPLPGSGNFVASSAFVDANGADDVAGTDDDDFRLRADSNAIDRANGSFPADVGDLDADGNVAEPLPLDADFATRAVDDVHANLGTGAIPFADVGAHEFVRPYHVLCVDDDASGNESGIDWANAKRSLQSALAEAQTIFDGTPIEIWVAKGAYAPTDRHDREASFKIPAGVAMYGGFSGAETSRAERRPLEVPTILTGEIGDPSLDDNSFYVVDFANDSIGPTTILDGFVVTRGNANGGPAPVMGGGIRVWNGASPTIRCSSIVGNAGDFGAGIGISGSSTAPVIHNCLISGNVADGVGGGIGIAGNSAGTQVVSCTIVANAASDGGGIGLKQSGSAVAIRNSILFYNEDSDGNGEKAQLEASSAAQISLIASCMPCAGSAFGGIAMVGQDPAFVRLAGDDELIGTPDDSALLAPFSPCIDAGMPDAGAAYPGDIGDSNDDGVVGAAEPFPHDLAVHKRLVDDRAMIDRLETVLDIGAIESQETSRGTPPKPSDLNGDGQTNGADLAILLGAFGTDGPAGDINGDCIVDGADIGIVLGDWN
ncbi:MAG: hypothetical protein JNM94_14945 [Phycisphaerae bacterium]|nr:hypothetical protein [Phycisphaerae bacterium]